MPAQLLREEIVILEHYEWQSRLANTNRAKGFGEGFAEGMATALAIVLETRGITVPEEIRERVMSCTDTDQLERWVHRAAVMDTAESLLG